MQSPETTPALILANALASRVAAIDGIAVHGLRDRAKQRSIARVYPYRASFAPIAPDDDRISIYGGIIPQIETMQFEIALRITDLAQHGAVFEIENEIIKALTGFQPYYGVVGSSDRGLTPFYPTGSIRQQGIRSQGSPIFERIIVVECKMERVNGLPPMMVPNNLEPLDFENKVDVFGYMPWDIVS